ncbi:uncharacterized protein LOC143284298 [Babylonia areolata]|uniref:uncharacterized protein LOC143284298 n=1 Tax=Babylonia areolata TaxID=304850 RepID=UPI003FD07B4B
MDCYRVCTLCVFLPVFVVTVLWSVGEVCCQQQYGTKFIVALPFGQDPSKATANQDLRLLLTNPGNAEVTVTVNTNGQSLTPITIPAEGFVNSLLTPPSSSFLLPASGQSVHLTVILESSGRFGVIVQGSDGYDGYMAIPVTKWGGAYRVATLCHGDNSTCQIVILASEADTQVTVTIPAENAPFRVDDANTNYAGADTMSKTLGQNEAWVIARGYEMSGALVDSSRNVGVLAGSQWTTFKGSGGIVMEQLPPLSTLGQEYVSLGGGTVRVVSTEPNTTLRTTDTPAVFLPAAGQWMQHYFQDPVHIRANRPVLVVQFMKLQLTSASPWFPAFTVLTPVVQYLNPGATPVLIPDYKLLAVVREKYKGHVQYGGVRLNETSAVSRSAVRSDYRVVVMEVAAPVPVRVSGSSQEVVGLYLQRVEAHLAQLSPLAAHYENVNEKDCGLTTPQNPDLTDNDCDGLVDEDDCVSSSGGIDCGLPNAVSSGFWGRHFVVVVPEYLELAAASLALTTFTDSGPVQIHVDLPNGVKQTVTLQNSADTQSVGVNFTNIMLSENMRTNVIRVTSDADISVMFQINGTIGDLPQGVMRLIPEEAVGREYYVVTVCGIKSCYVEVVGLRPNTSINIYLKLGSEPTSNVIFGGRSYTDGDVIRLDIGSYEAVIFECEKTCDMTGTLVVASKPVAVFAMSRFEKWFYQTDFFFGQMPPMETYGEQFIVMHEPARVLQSYCLLGGKLYCNSQVWIVSTEMSTTVKVFDGTVTNSHTLDSAGDSLVFEMNGKVVQIDSDQPLLVAQTMHAFRYSQYDYRGALLIVSSVSHYSQEDLVKFEALNPSDLKELVMYSVDPQPLQVTIDGGLEAMQTLVEGPLLNVSYLVKNCTKDTARISLSGTGTFGGYVSETGKTLFPLTYSPDHPNVGCPVTKPVRGDDEDNDCDGVVDEESCPEGSLSDDDGDGRFNEDCQQPPEVTTTEPPETTTAEETTPEDTTPEDTTPEVTTPEVTTPEVTTPEDTTPEDTTSSSVSPTPTTSSSVTPSSTATTSSSSPLSLCSCNCQRSSASTSMPPESLTSVLSSIVSELSVDRQNLSSTRRKKISAEDDRPSAQTVGYFGVAIIVATGLGIVILDSGALYRDIKKLLASCKKT